MREAGIYSGVDIDVYHNEEGISASGLNLILDCPKRYWHEYMVIRQEQQIDNRKQRDKFKLGRALHMLVLETEKFEKTFYPMTEEVNLTTKIGKEKYAEAEFLAEGRQIIRAGDWSDIWEMAQAAKSHPVWKHLQDGKVEQSVYWNSGIYQTRLKARPDIFNGKLIMDIKTTDSIRGFQRTMYQYGYHRQAALQIDALKQIDGLERFFAFFVIEKKAPYLTACFTLDPDSLQQGRQEYEDGAATYSECVKYNSWPGYDEKFQITSIPTWAVKKEEIY